MRYPLLGLIALIGLLGCADDLLVTPETMSGSWAMKRLGGQSLPVSVGSSDRYNADTLTLGTDGTFLQVRHRSALFTEGGTSTWRNEIDTLRGSWTLDGATIDLLTTGSPTRRGSFGGDSLTFSAHFYVYRRVE